MTAPTCIPKPGEKWTRNAFDNLRRGPGLRPGACVEILRVYGHRVMFSHGGRTPMRRSLEYFLARYAPDLQLSDRGSGDCTAALLAVLRAHHGLPAIAHDVRVMAGRVLDEAKRPWTSADWGDSVRWLRGRGILVEAEFGGATTWKLGKDDPELVTAGWPDDGAESVLKETNRT